MRYRGTFNYYNPIVAQENSVGRIVFLTELSFFLTRCVQNACEQGNRGCYAGFLVGKQGRGQRDASTRRGLERVTRESCRHALTSHAPPLLQYDIALHRQSKLRFLRTLPGPTPGPCFPGGSMRLDFPARHVPPFPPVFVYTVPATRNSFPYLSLCFFSTQNSCMESLHLPQTYWTFSLKRS